MKRRKSLKEVGRCRFINPYTDFGFHRFFGTEKNKELLMSFLSAIVTQPGNPVVEVCYLPEVSDAFLNVLCRRKSGESFVVMIQNAHHGFAKDLGVRHLFRGASPTFDRRQETCLLALTCQSFHTEQASQRYLHEVRLMSVEDNHVFYKPLKMVFVEMPKFEKRAEELRTMGDKWLFALKNLPFFGEIPKVLKSRVFEQLFEQADMTRFTLEERLAYQRSLTALGRCGPFLKDSS